MNLYQRQIFGLKKIGNGNTSIGGVSSVITTASALATILGISTSNITNFTIVGGDINCNITTSYTIPDSAFENNTSITYYDDFFGKCTAIGANTFVGCLNMLIQYFPNVTSVGNGAFGYQTKAKIIYTPKCVLIGFSNSSNTSVFFNINRNCRIYVDPSMATINSGGPEADLAAATTAGALVRYVSNYTVPPIITDLTAANVYSTSVKLSWTAPSSANSVDFYEIYVNGVFNKTTTNNFSVVLNLTNSSNYNFTVKAVDVFYNKSGFSNTVNQTINGSANYREKIIAYWKFNNDFADSVNSNNGTPTSVSFGTGKISNAAVFNGSSSNLTIADNNVLSFTDGANDLPTSGSFWIKFNSTADQWIINKRDNASTQNEWQFCYASGGLSFAMFTSNGSAYILKSYSFTPTIGQWYHVAYTYSGNRLHSGITLYLDKVSVGTGSSSGTYTGMTNTASGLRIGRAGWTSSFYLNATLEEMLLLNKELNSTEVTDIYTEQNAGRELI